MAALATTAALQRSFPRSSVLHDLAAIAGRMALGVGLVILLHAAQHQWGTAAEEARAQQQLRDAFERVLPAPAVSAVVSPPSIVAPASSTTTTIVLAPPAPGTPLAILRIPRLGVDKVVVEGAETAQLELGPGHYPTTPLPGAAGNVAIAGHRTTYGAPFRHLDDLEPGDEITLTTMLGERRYVVERAFVVEPEQVEVLAPTGDDRLTLTTCDPPGSDRYRLIVTALQVDDGSSQRPQRW